MFLISPKNHKHHFQIEQLFFILSGPFILEIVKSQIKICGILTIFKKEQGKLGSGSVLKGIRHFHPVTKFSHG